MPNSNSVTKNTTIVRRTRRSLSLSLSLTLSLTHTQWTPYVYINVSRMDSNHTWSLFTYEYDTNINVCVWHEWEQWLELFVP